MEETLFNEYIKHIKKNIPTELPFNNQGLTSKQVQTLCAELLYNSSVQTLDLSSNNLDETSIVALAELLKYNSNISLLNLSQNSLDSTTTAILVKHIKENIGLRKLDLSATKIGDSRLLPLVEALKHNKGLVSLDLGRNLISDTGLAALASLLDHNSNLQYLSLQHNMIGIRLFSAHGVGIERFINAVTRHTGLKHLDMSHNHLGVQAINLLRSLKNNHHLHSLDITDVELSHQLDSEIAALEKTLEWNFSLSIVEGIEKEEGKIFIEIPALFRNYKMQKERLKSLPDQTYNFPTLDSLEFMAFLTGSDASPNIFLYRHFMHTTFLTKHYDSTSSSLQVALDIMQKIGEFVGEHALRNIAIQARGDLLTKYLTLKQHNLALALFPQQTRLGSVLHEQTMFDMLLHRYGLGNIGKITSKHIKQLLFRSHPDKGGTREDFCFVMKLRDGVKDIADSTVKLLKEDGSSEEDKKEEKKDEKTSEKENGKTENASTPDSKKADSPSDTNANTHNAYDNIKKGEGNKSLSEQLQQQNDTPFELNLPETNTQKMKKETEEEALVTRSQKDRKEIEQELEDRQEVKAPNLLDKGAGEEENTNEDTETSMPVFDKGYPSIPEEGVVGPPTPIISDPSFADSGAITFAVSFGMFILHHGGKHLHGDLPAPDFPDLFA